MNEIMYSMYVLAYCLIILVRILHKICLPVPECYKLLIFIPYFREQNWLNLQVQRNLVRPTDYLSERL